jgi:NTP pyrophosphatase (non-canonical NTP hydrolase)
VSTRIPYLDESPTSGHPRTAVQRTAVMDVLFERDRQMAKWGIQTHSMYKWLAILTEEVGEFAEPTLGTSRDALRGEAIQVAAVALAIVEFIDRYAAAEPPVKS